MISSAQEILKKHFGFEQFRPQQAEIIERVLDKKDALVLMPTDGGKSVCITDGRNLHCGISPDLTHERPGRCIEGERHQAESRVDAFKSC